jgi:ATP-dependent DNA helicase 2 subunit 1
MSVINAPKILDLNQLIDGLLLSLGLSTIYLTLRVSEARNNPDLLSEDYPSTDKHIPVGDLFTSCNWVLRDGYCHFKSPPSAMLINVPCSAPKSATKRVFLITDDDDPFAGSHNPRLITSARTTLIVCEKFLQIDDQG